MALRDRACLLSCELLAEHGPTAELNDAPERIGAWHAQAKRVWMGDTVTTRRLSGTAAKEISWLDIARAV